MGEKIKVIPWSYSAMNTFETCPRQYEAKHVTKEVPFVQNEAGKWGDEVHKALENAIKLGRPLPSNMVQYKPFLDAVKRRAEKLGGKLIAEQQVAVTRDLKFVSWFTKRTAENPVWFRTKIDATVLCDGYAEIYDWKTGKKKDDSDQLLLYVLVLFLLYPNIQRVKVGFVWLKEGEVDPPVEYTRDQLPEILEYWEKKYEVLEEAWVLNDFPPKPSGLCKRWCEVTSCPHNGQNTSRH